MEGSDAKKEMEQILALFMDPLDFNATFPVAGGEDADIDAQASSKKHACAKSLLRLSFDILDGLYDEALQKLATESDFEACVTDPEREADETCKDLIIAVRKFAALLDTTRQKRLCFAEFLVFVCHEQL